MVSSGVSHPIPDRVLVQLHPDDLPRLFRGDDPYGSDAAVGVDHRLPAGQSRQFHGLGVEFLCLHRVYLVKRPAGNPENPAAQFILNISLPVQHIFPIPQHHAGLPVIKVLDNGSDLRVFLPKRLDKMILRRKYRGGCHQNHHDLSCGKSSLYQHMPQKSISRVLVVGLDLKGFKQPTDSPYDLVRLFVLQHTLFHSHKLVTPFLINAGDHLPFLVSKGTVNLVAVMERLFHPLNRIDLTESLQQFFHLPLFLLELTLIGDIQELAATAPFGNRAQALLDLRPFWLWCLAPFFLSALLSHSRVLLFPGILRLPSSVFCKSLFIISLLCFLPVFISVSFSC